MMTGAQFVSADGTRRTRTTTNKRQWPTMWLLTKDGPLYYSLRCPVRKKYNPCGLEWYNTETKIDCMKILFGNLKGRNCFVGHRNWWEGKRNGKACTAHPILCGWLNLEQWDGLGMWRVWVRRGWCIGSWWGNWREGDHWGDLGVDGWIILGWISRRWDVGIWTGLGWPRIETGGGRLWGR